MLWNQVSLESPNCLERICIEDHSASGRSKNERVVLVCLERRSESLRSHARFVLGIKAEAMSRCSCRFDCTTLETGIRSEVGVDVSKIWIRSPEISILLGEHGIIFW